MPVPGLDPRARPGLQQVVRLRQRDHQDRRRPARPGAFAGAGDGLRRRAGLLRRPRARSLSPAHAGSGFVGHNLTFDLKVTQRILGGAYDLYTLVDQNKLWDTLVLKRLLSLATDGHTAQGVCGLDDCARDHLGLALPKVLRDPQGEDVRTGFGRFLGRPLADMPEIYLRYAAGDALVTWHLFWELNKQIKLVLQRAGEVWGYAGEPG